MTSLKKGFKRYWQLYLLLLPALVYLLIFRYGPMYGVLMAFQNYRPRQGILGSEWVGFDHFIRFFQYPEFWTLMKNTLSISLYTLCTFPCAIILALLFNEIRSTKFKKTVQMVTYAPYFLSTVVLCSLVTLMVGRDGPIGHLYAALTGTSTDLLSVPQYFSSIYVWSGVWQSTGWGTIIYLAALSGVSEDLVEAARIDGANKLKIMWHVHLPGIMPTIVIMFIMQVGHLLTVGFEKIFLLQNDLNLSASNVLSTYTYQIGLIGGQFSYSTAIGLFNNLANLIMLLLANRITKKISGMGLF